MRTSEALEFFSNSRSELAAAAGVTPDAVTKWGDTVPKGRRRVVRLAMKERAEKLEAEAKRLRRSAKELEKIELAREE